MAKKKSKLGLTAVAVIRDPTGRIALESVARTVRAVNALEGLAAAYGAQLDAIGRTLVEAGYITDEDIARHGVHFAVKHRFGKKRKLVAKAKKARR